MAAGRSLNRPEKLHHIQAAMLQWTQSSFLLTAKFSPMILRPGTLPPPNDEFPVYARDGWPIPQEKPGVGEAGFVETLKPERLRIHARTLPEIYPSLFPPSEIRSASGHLYNCVGMVFASRRVSIAIDEVENILRHDGYRQITREIVMAGDVVLYKNSGIAAHVGLIVQVDQFTTMTKVRNIKVLSKWGYDPEVLHFIEHVPTAYGTTHEFYTERPL